MNIELSLPGKSFFSPPAPPPLPPPPPPPPTREAPDVLAAKKRLKDSEAKRKGRAANILTREDSLGEAPLVRPEAGSDTLG